MSYTPCILSKRVLYTLLIRSAVSPAFDTVQTWSLGCGAWLNKAESLLAERSLTRKRCSAVPTRSSAEPARNLQAYGGTEDRKRMGNFNLNF